MDKSIIQSIELLKIDLGHLNRKISALKDESIFVDYLSNLAKEAERCLDEIVEKLEN